MKLVVFNAEDPNLAITFEHTPPEHTRWPGWYGTCTQCGLTMHHETEHAAFTDGQTHVDTCDKL